MRQKPFRRILMLVGAGMGIGIILVAIFLFFSSYFYKSSPSITVNTFIPQIIATTTEPSKLPPISSIFVPPAYVPPVVIPVAPLFVTTTPMAIDESFNASYTELFSGTGKSDAAQTSGYLDTMTTAITLQPEFTVRLANGSEMNGGQIPNVPANIIGTITKIGEAYEVRTLGPTFISPYKGVLRFGYNPTTRSALIIYAAYMSRVFQVSESGAVIDYSDRFGPRAFGGASNGELAVYPTIFSKDGDWWIASGEGSTKSFLAKISGSSVIDYASPVYLSLALPQEDILRATPSAEPHSVLITREGKTFLLKDGGFSQENTRWVSLRLNDWDGEISKAIISRADDSESYKKTVGFDEGSVQYFLSNDGGNKWMPAKLGEAVTFSSSGGDLRFKAELSPAKNNKYVTPWTGTIALEYKIKR